MGIRTRIIGLIVLGACSPSAPPSRQNVDGDEVKTTYSEEFLQLWNVCDGIGTKDGKMTDFQMEVEWTKRYSKLPDTVKVLGLVDNVVYDSFGPALFLKPPDKRNVTFIIGRMANTKENANAALSMNVGDTVVVFGKLDKEGSCQPRAVGGFTLWVDVYTTDIIPK